jgi:rhodanese-related sulfurtransferase
LEIGLFQLENLIISRSPFVFLDVRANPSGELPVEIERCLKVAHAIKVEEAEKYLNDQGGSKERPIVLVCNSGGKSSKLAAQLETAGYTNVYYIAGGVAGLVGELR